MSLNRRIGTGVGVALLACAIAFAQGATRLFLNGKLVSSRVKVINGVPYVPIADVAKGQGLQLVKRGDGYNLLPEGGANQMAGKFEGKIGERLFTGKYGILVRSVERVDSYAGKHTNLFGNVEGDETSTVILVNCTLSNGVKTSQNLVVGDWSYGPKSIETTNMLADKSGRSFPVTKYDVACSEIAPCGVKMLPGATFDFTLVFKVPRDSEPKDLLFSFLPYDRRADDKPVNVRISLVK